MAWAHVCYVCLGAAVMPRYKFEIFLVVLGPRHLTIVCVILSFDVIELYEDYRWIGWP